MKVDPEGGGVFPTQDDPEAATAGRGHTAGECESPCSMLNVSRWSRCANSWPPAAGSALPAPSASRSTASSSAPYRRTSSCGYRMKDKGVVRRYLAKISGRSLAQITRLIRRYPPKRARRSRPAPPASLPAPLHTRRHRSVGHHGQCGPRGAFGPGAAAHPMARKHHVHGKHGG